MNEDLVTNICYGKSPIIAVGEGDVSSGGIPVPQEFQEVIKAAYDEHDKTGKPFSAILVSQQWTLPQGITTCGNCGGRIEPEWRTCPFCGKAFDDF